MLPAPVIAYAMREMLEQLAQRHLEPTPEVVWTQRMVLTGDGLIMCLATLLPESRTPAEIGVAWSVHIEQRVAEQLTPVELTERLQAELDASLPAVKAQWDHLHAAPF